MTHSKTIILSLLSFLPTFFILLTAQPSPGFRIIAYYNGPTNLVDSFEIEKLTHLIFSFGHLDGNQLRIANAEDSATIKRMVRLKNRNPELKVMLSLGGWGGCETCSDVFNSTTGRKEFAQSVKELSAYFLTDGIDLDWEYPTIPGYPGHTFRLEDRTNFTSVLKELRKVNGENFEISFAAGGFTEFIDSSVEWNKVIVYTDFINIMTYDLVHGNSTTSGHHTPLYSTPKQIESTDHAVQLLVKAGVPASKLVIGAAFYGRLFRIEQGKPVDLYMPCQFAHGFSYNTMNDTLSSNNGFVRKWDDVAKAPYAINIDKRLLATYDDQNSMALKTKYAKEKNLGGIMFWQLGDDKFHDGLLDTIYKNK